MVGECAVATHAHPSSLKKVMCFCTLASFFCLWLWHQQSSKLAWNMQQHAHGFAVHDAIVFKVRTPARLANQGIHEQHCFLMYFENKVCWPIVQQLGCCPQLVAIMSSPECRGKNACCDRLGVSSWSSTH